MLTVWIILIAVAAVSIFRGMRAVRSGELQFTSVRVVLAALIIIVAWGFFAAAQLGFILNHAP
jgi:hypothetical protein